MSAEADQLELGFDPSPVRAGTGTAGNVDPPQEEQPPVAPSQADPTPPVLPDPEPEADPSTVKPEDQRNETERLDPQPVEMVLLSGTEFDLEPLRLRQFLRLLRIVTRGAAGVLDQAELDFEDAQAFAQTFLGMVLFAIPEAEEETVDFLKSMVKPQNPTGDPKKDLLRLQALYEELDNPELEDCITIIQSIIEREAEDLRALGKRLGAMFQTAQKIGRV